MNEESGDEGGTTDGPSWKPAMTRREADRWSRDSAYRAPVYHATSPHSARAIHREGFSLGLHRLGRLWGNGVYAATDDQTIRYYMQDLVRRGDQVELLELRVNVRRVLTIWIDASSRHSPFDQAIRQLPGGFGDYLLHFVGTRDRALAMTRQIRSAGYDAFEVREDAPTAAVGGNQLLVFDPRQVTIVDDEA